MPSSPPSSDKTKVKHNRRMLQHEPCQKALCLIRQSPPPHTHKKKKKDSLCVLETNGTSQLVLHLNASQINATLSNQVIIIVMIVFYQFNNCNFNNSILILFITIAKYHIFTFYEHLWYGMSFCNNQQFRYIVLHLVHFAMFR